MSSKPEVAVRGLRDGRISGSLEKESEPRQEVKRLKKFPSQKCLLDSFTIKHQCLEFSVPFKMLQQDKNEKNYKLFGHFSFSSRLPRFVQSFIVQFSPTFQVSFCF